MILERFARATGLRRRELEFAGMRLTCRERFRALRPAEISAVFPKLLSYSGEKRGECLITRCNRCCAVIRLVALLDVFIGHRSPCLLPLLPSNLEASVFGD